MSWPRSIRNEFGRSSYASFSEQRRRRRPSSSGNRDRASTATSILRSPGFTGGCAVPLMRRIPPVLRHLQVNGLKWMARRRSGGHELIEPLFQAALTDGEKAIESATADTEAKREVSELLRSYREWSANLPPPVSSALPRFGPYQCDAILGAGGMG